jgi:hypothetical protein
MTLWKSNSKYIPEPALATEHFKSSSSAYELLTLSTQVEGRLARARLNSWLGHVDDDERPVFMSRLNTKHNHHFDAAIWELFLNSLFRYLGFNVTRLKNKDEASTPDYLIRKWRRSFILEATSISDSPKRPAENHWKMLISYLEATVREDFYISVIPGRVSDSPPKMKKIRSEIIKYLDELIYDEVKDFSILQLPSKSVCVDEWELQVRAIPKKDKVDDGIFVAISGNGGSGQITTLLDLRNKIEDKRLKYRNLEHPLIIAVLENSLFPNSDDWHRIGALFGQEALQIGENNQAKAFRQQDGIWDLENGENRVSALLLQGRLNIFLETLDSPELWLNPKISQDFKFLLENFTSTTVKNDSLFKDAKDLRWDGLSKSPLKNRTTRILTRLLLILGVVK